MKKIAFVDLKEHPSVYIFEKKSGGLVLKDTVPMTARGNSAYTLERPLEGLEETYLSIPMEALNFRIIDFPFGDRERIREVLPFELDRLVLGGSEKTVCDACVLGEHDGKYRALVAYIVKDTLKMILGGLKQSGIDARVVTSVETAAALDSFSSEEEITKLVIGTDEKAAGTGDRADVARKEIEKPTINLRRGDFSYTGDTEKAKKSLKLTLSLAFLAMLVFAADASLKIISSQKEAAAIREGNRKTYARMFPGEKNVSGVLYRMKAHLKEIRDKENVFSGIEPLQGLSDLASASGQGVTFTEIVMDKERVVLKGECPSLSDVQRLKGALEKSFPGVSITDTKASVQNRIGFTITAKGRGV